jgi:magnesium transporter
MPAGFGLIGTHTDANLLRYACPVSTRILAWNHTLGALREAEISELPELLAAPDSVVWIDMHKPASEERACLLDTFKLHPMVVEDLLADAATPKLERFEGYLYVVLHALLPGWERATELPIGELDVLIGKNFVVTSHEQVLPSIASTHALVTRDPSTLSRGPAYVAYAIADVLTDRFLPLMERLDRDIDQLETTILKHPGPALLETIFELKHKLQRVRRLALHQREVLSQLSRTDKDLALIPPDVKPFFRDAYDNFVRVVDLNDSFREIVSSSMDAYLSMQGHKLNEIMKVLTLISTIMLPLTFIAGVYGMNFEAMPELHWRYGYFAALGAMLVTAAIFFAYFSRKGWI